MKSKANKTRCEQDKPKPKGQTKGKTTGSSSNEKTKIHNHKARNGCLFGIVFVSSAVVVAWLLFCVTVTVEKGTFEMCV